MPRHVASRLRRALACATPLLLAALSLLAPMNAPAAPLPAEQLLTSRRPLVIGHRGYAAVAPENSLVSFQRALDAGVDLVELDYYHSADGTPVVIHDGTLDRTTDAPQRWNAKGIQVTSRTAADLTTLDVGAWFKPPFSGQTLPTLDRALTLIQARGVTLIERKHGDPATLIRLLRQRDLVNRVVVQSFDWEYLREFHQLEPRQVLGALGPPSERGGRKLTDPEKALNAAWLEDIQSLGARVAVWNRQVDRDAIRRAHRRGLAVWCYTINETEAASQLLDLGVNGIISDNPPAACRAIALHASR